MKRNNRKISGLYLDCSKIPVKSKWFIFLLGMLKKNGMKYFFIKFGEYFPWNEDFKFKSSYVYPEQVVEGLVKKAQQFDITIVPVLPFLKEMDFIKKEKHYKYLSEDNPVSFGIFTLYEEMILDILSLFPNASYICLDIPDKKDVSIEIIVTRFDTFLTGEGKKLLVESDSSMIENIKEISIKTNNTLIRNEDSCKLTLNGMLDGILLRIISDFDILIPSCFENDLSVFFMDVEESDTLCRFKEIKKNFNVFSNLHKEVWNSCISASELLVRNELRPDSSEVMKLMTQFKKFMTSYEELKKRSEVCVRLLSGDFEDSYVSHYFISKTEPLEMILNFMSFQVRKIEGRLF